MATTELKTVEKLVKEILDIVKSTGASVTDGKSIDGINTKLDAIVEANSSAAELVKKVEKLSTKVDKKSKDYIKEIHAAFDAYQQKKVELLADTGISDSSDMKDCVAIITNEMLELKNKFESFSEEFSDLSLNTTMATSKEIISMKNHVLSLSDSIENVKSVFEEMKWNEAIVSPVSNSVNEIFTSSLNTFKESIFGVMAKIMDGVDSIIAKAADNAKIMEGFENLLGEIIQNQQKNKDEILKIVNANIAEENKKLLPKIVQVVSSISFDENAEDIKECIDGLGDDLDAVNNNVEVVNQNLEIVNQNVETLSEDVQNVAQQVDTISQNMDTANKDIEVVSRHVEVTNQNVETNITVSHEILEKVEALKEVVGPEVTTEILEQVNKINSSVGSDMLKKISKINETLDTVTSDFNILTKGSKEDTEDYVYTLLDLESDISKVRMLLDDLTHSLQNDKNTTEASTKEISEKIATISSHIKQTEDVFTAPDYQAILQQFDALNDDITSISKRTNKLILTSDDSSVKLEKNIEDFQNILKRISVTVKNFENSSVIKNISLRTGNIQKMLQTSLQSDKAINEAFIHLAGWVDGTSVELDALKAELLTLSKKIDNLALVQDEKQETTVTFDDAQILTALENVNKKIDANSKKIDLLEKKIASSDEMKSSIDFLVAQVQIINENMTNNKTLTKKIDKMEKQIQQLLSYVEEE